MSSLLSQRKKARSLLVQSLYEWHMSGNPMAEIIAHRLATQESDIDVTYYSEALHTVNQERETIDKHLEPFLDRPLKELDPVELAVMRMACFELLYRLDIPYRVVINEALENAKKFGAQDGYKFVNGVLDKLSGRIRFEERRKK